jgi:hypothetical protein
VRRGATHRIAICGREKYCRLCALRIIDLEVSLPIRGKARFSVSVCCLHSALLILFAALMPARATSSEETNTATTPMIYDLLS